MAKIVYKQLSYKIIGICYEIYNDLGGGYQEKYYYKAISHLLKENRINFKHQVRADLNFKDYNLGRYFIDFLIENKIVLEIKATSNFTSKDIKQILAYLQKTKMELGILVGFTKQGVIFKRILRGY